MTPDEVRGSWRISSRATFCSLRSLAPCKASSSRPFRWRPRRSRRLLGCLPPWEEGSLLRIRRSSPARPATTSEPTNEARASSTPSRRTRSSLTKPARSQRTRTRLPRTDLGADQRRTRRRSGTHPQRQLHLKRAHTRGRTTGSTRRGRQLGRTPIMAKLSTTELLDAFKELTLTRAQRVRQRNSRPLSA